MTKRPDSALDRGVEELTLLFEISQALEQSLDLRENLGQVLRLMAERMGMVRGTVALVNRETDELVIDAAHGLSDSQIERGRYRVGEGVMGKVVKSGRPAVVPNVSKEPMFLNRTRSRRGVRKQDISFLCIPIKLGREVIGVLTADRLFEETVSLDEDVRLLTIIASIVAQAARLRQSIQEEQHRLVEENLRLQHELEERFHPSNIVGRSRIMEDVFDLIAQVSRSDATVLIRGESGTGKELVAHAIHYNSPRRSKPFVKVNCAGLPESLIESELFGHEKGAFTGAIQRREGRFELAQGGAIFLDEIGDLSPTLQIRLLRVLQEKEFERVGGTQTLKADVRIVTATNRNLEQIIAEGRFREDLYYRLNVFPIHVPPLRERKSDILLLADHFVEKYGKAGHKAIKRISTPAIDMLMAYHWPGNVRELENSIERAALLSNDGVIHGHHLPPSLQTAEASGTAHTGTLRETLDNVERELVLDALKSARGNMAKAARALGITERIMGLRIRKHNIDAGRFKGGG